MIGELVAYVYKLLFEALIFNVKFIISTFSLITPTIASGIAKKN